VRGGVVSVRSWTSADQVTVTVSWRRHRDVTVRCWSIRVQGEWAWHRRSLERGQSARRMALETRINYTTPGPRGTTWRADTGRTCSRTLPHSVRRCPAGSDWDDTISLAGEAQRRGRHNGTHWENSLADTITCVF
jgi:hypothetical protein